MTRSPRLVLGIALAALVILGDSHSAQAQRRNRSNSSGSNNNENNNNDNANNSGGNNSDNQRGGRRNRNRDNDDNAGSQQLQQIIQGGQGGQGNQNNTGNLQQQRRRGQQGGQRSNDGQNLQQFFQDGHNHQGENWQSRKHKHHHDLENWVIGFNGGPRPFTGNWYKNHPHAWHHHNHHHDDDYWKVATAGAVIGWLGWQNHPHHHSMIVYDPVPVDTYLVDGQPSVVVDANSPGEWLALGAFTLLTGADDPGTRILQLSVDKHGHVRGSYFDMITNATQNVFGVIDQNTQQVRWTLDTNRKLTFVATLNELTQPQGVVNVKLPGGQVQQWQLVRMEDPGN